jgi:hypothetical protein
MPLVATRRTWGPGLGLVVGASLLVAGCAQGIDAPPASAPSATPTPLAERPLPGAANETALLDAAFRIEISRIDVVFDLFPGEARGSAQARVAFRMRPGQSLPIFHFEPARTAPDVALRLDGEPLDLASERDARFFTFRGSGQTSLELERSLPQGQSHALEAGWSFALSDSGGRFFADVNDIRGNGNEVYFPTLNTPHELARHVITFRVHAANPYLMVGSGLVTPRQGPDAQEWVLDSERAVASYTVMFHLAPASSHALARQRIAGVDVRVLVPNGGVTADQAFTLLAPWLAELQRSLGPFPMPRGLSVVLTQGGGGMEYFGATTTSLDALRHEVFHMYFGCSTVARTYRDSWWDEAIDMWYELSSRSGVAPISEGFRSGIVNDRSAIAKGFDTRAYSDGARIFEAVAVDLGGRQAMTRFLRQLHERRSFDPFTTWQLAGELQAWSGISFHERFRSWLYQGPEAVSAVRSEWDWLHRVDTRLPSETR